MGNIIFFQNIHKNENGKEHQYDEVTSITWKQFFMQNRVINPIYSTFISSRVLRFGQDKKKNPVLNTKKRISSNKHLKPNPCGLFSLRTVSVWLKFKSGGILTYQLYLPKMQILTKPKIKPIANPTIKLAFILLVFTIS